MKYLAMFAFGLAVVVIFSAISDSFFSGGMAGILISTVFELIDRKFA